MKSKILFALLMGVVTTGIISFSLLAINLGFTGRFINVWIKSWILGYFIVIPVILIVGPRIQKFVNWMLQASNC